MKVAVCSDLHLEFGPISLENTEGANVLILSGDICVAKDMQAPDMYGINTSEKMKRVYTFFKECSERFPNVIYIAGNHEHYHGDFRYTLGTLKYSLRDLKNVHVLEKEYMDIGGTMFFGATLWTDMNKEDPHTMYSIRNYMNDYRIITDADATVYFRDADGNSQERKGKFTPEVSVEEHKTTLLNLKDGISAHPDKNWVVVGHHAPSKKSTKPQYEDDVMVNGAYSSDLSEFILEHPQIKLWTHGHTHHDFDYMVGDTRIVANPRGYIGYEHQADVFELKFFNV